MGLVTVTVAVEDGGAAPLDGVTVRVFQSDGTTYVTEGVTGTPTPGSGQVEFTLNGDGVGIEYVLRLSRVGRYFPGGATQTISVTDPPAPNNDFGPYVAETGPTDILVEIVVQDDELLPSPIEDVRVRIYDGAAFVTEGDTDSNGKFAVFLSGAPSPGTQYTVHVKKDGVAFESPTQTIAVLDPLAAGQTNIFDITGTLISPSVATDPDLCRVTGTLVDLSLYAAKYAVIEFKPIPAFVPLGSNQIRESGRFLGVGHSIPALVRDKILVRGKQVRTDSAGKFHVDLPRGGCYQVHIHGLEDPIEITEYIYVPDSSHAEFIDLLYPRVLSLEFDDNPITVAVGASLEVPFTLVLSNGQPLTDQSLISELLTFSAANDALIEVTLFSVSSVNVKGLAAGSTQVDVERIEEKVVTRLPPFPALVSTPLDVTVT